MSALFTPVALGPRTAPNRIAISPMCQYSAVDGMPTDWHLQNAMTLAMSGAGLVMIEATAVEARGRITHGCLGIYSDAHQAAIARMIAAARGVAPVGTQLGIQLGHAGRKGSAQRPWEGGKALGGKPLGAFPEKVDAGFPNGNATNIDSGGTPPSGSPRASEHPWTTVAPSAVPFAGDWPLPHELAAAELDGIREAFVTAARRAVEAGFDVVELHCAHGYLIHQFLSALSNKRQDDFGGAAGRPAFPLAVARAVREAVPSSRALGARITGTDWVEGGLNVDDAIAFAGALEQLGFDYVCVTSGGLVATARIPVAPGYQVPFAEAVKRATGIKVRTVGMIADAAQAEGLIADRRADMVAIARAAIDDPRWPWHAAARLGAEITRPAPYARAAPASWPGYVLAHPEASAR